MYYRRVTACLMKEGGIRIMGHHPAVILEKGGAINRIKQGSEWIGFDLELTGKRLDPIRPETPEKDPALE